MLSRCNRADTAFMLLFAFELTFYLLILQTGIVEYHHSDLQEIWMVPVGGVLGIISSIYVYPYRRTVVPLLLAMQIFFSFHYAHDSGMDMFFLGLISGLVAPQMIARIDGMLPVVFALALSYVIGTFNFDLPADERTSIAVILSVVAFAASLFADLGRPKVGQERYSVQNTATVFFWLILDAALFETLLRDPQMKIWGEPAYTQVIILFHIVGIAAAYRLREWHRNDLFIVLLFALTYTVYTLGIQIILSVVYPFVISYYNVIILEQFRKIHYPNLAFVALSLWIASGFGLMIALTHNFAIAWTVLALLGLIYLIQQRKEYA